MKDDFPVILALHAQGSKNSRRQEFSSISIARWGSYPQTGTRGWVGVAATGKLKMVGVEGEISKPSPTGIPS